VRVSLRFGTPEDAVLYRAMPYGGNDLAFCGGLRVSPNRDIAADAEINLTSHEQMELATELGDLYAIARIHPIRRPRRVGVMISYQNDEKGLYGNLLQGRKLDEYSGSCIEMPSSQMLISATC
jgi:hypothetical protein